MAQEENLTPASIGELYLEVQRLQAERHWAQIAGMARWAAGFTGLSLNAFLTPQGQTEVLRWWDIAVNPTPLPRAIMANGKADPIWPRYLLETDLSDACSSYGASLEEALTFLAAERCLLPLRITHKGDAGAPVSVPIYSGFVVFTPNELWGSPKTERNQDWLRRFWTQLHAGTSESPNLPVLPPSLEEDELKGAITAYVAAQTGGEYETEETTLKEVVEFVLDLAG